jgi:hypothetical protein
MVGVFTTTSAISAYHRYICKLESRSWQGVLDWVMVFNATFNNISVISWQSILLVEETQRKP